MNFNIDTHPTGRSPKGKFFFGENAYRLCKDRPNDVQIGNEADFISLLNKMGSYDYEHNSTFSTCGIDFNVATTSLVHHLFVGNMFRQKFLDEKSAPSSDSWSIIHNLELESNPWIYIHLDRKIVLITGTSFLGEIKKSVFTIIGYTLSLIHIPSPRD